MGRTIAVSVLLPALPFENPACRAAPADPANPAALCCAALCCAAQDVAVSSGSACTSASLEPSYVLRALGVEEELAHTSIR